MDKFSAPPQGVTEGFQYWDTTRHRVGQFNGTTFDFVATAGDVAAAIAGLATTPVAPVAPISPATGLNAVLPAMFPNAPWLQPVTEVVDVAMTAALQGDFSNMFLHMDATMPYTVVDSRVVLPVKVTIDPTNGYPADSDDVDVPVNDAIAAAGVEQGSDAHLLLYDVATETWINLYGFSGTAATGYKCLSKTLWDATWDWIKGNPRPFGATSEDAAGLPIPAFLVTYDNKINPVTVNGVQTLGHAMRITMKFLRTAGYSNGDGVWAMIPPASHTSPNLSGGPIAGMRLVLDPAYDTSALTGFEAVLANTAKIFGFIVCDLGTTGMFTAAADTRWTQADLDALKTIPVTALKVVTPGKIYVPAMPQQTTADLVGLVTVYPAGNPPTINNGVPAGQTYAYSESGIERVFPVAGKTLTAKNQFGAVTS